MRILETKICDIHICVFSTHILYSNRIKKQLFFSTPSSSCVLDTLRYIQKKKKCKIQELRSADVCIWVACLLVCVAAALSLIFI